MLLTLPKPTNVGLLGKTGRRLPQSNERGLNVSAANEQSSFVFLSLAAAAVGATCDLLSFVLWQSPVHLAYEQDISHVDAIISALLGFGFSSLMPLVVLVIFRKVVAITIPYALVLFIAFMGHAYYWARFNMVGISGLVRPFDMPTLLSWLISAMSVAVILVWALFRLMTVIVDVFTRKWLR